MKKKPEVFREAITRKAEKAESRNELAEYIERYIGVHG
jgi:hypothetical protein